MYVWHSMYFWGWLSILLFKATAVKNLLTD
jgi:hypothetical protein